MELARRDNQKIAERVCRSERPGRTVDFLFCKELTEGDAFALPLRQTITAVEYASDDASRN
jgi:hypothetical protein